ncbi:MAG: hypothetical protein ABI638_03300 [Ignavibacteriota bacterium]
MNDNKNFALVNLYFDGELNKAEEVDLFTLLANDEAVRNYFKQLSTIKNAVDNDSEDFPAELEERILRSVGTKVSAKAGYFYNIKIFSAISYAAALILLFLSGYLFFKVSNYQERVDNLSQQMIIQSQTIELLINSLPVVEVRATSNKDKLYKPNI